MTYNKNTWANHDLITSQKLNNIEDGINDVIDRVTYGTGGAEQPTQPIHTPVYLNLGDPLPTDAVSGDYAFIKDGDDFTIMEFNGVKWVEQINPNLKERIADVLAQAETRSQELVDENATTIGATLDEVQAKQADLTAQQAELDTKAQGYANKALADAKANTLATATQTAKDASDALAKAKTDLTTSLNKEVTDRANAVTTLDTKAKGYADTAKNDAISASTTALNTAKTDLTTSITKEVTDRTKAVSDLDTKAQGYATQAKTDAIATANGAVAKEVTDRQKAITDLDAKSTGAINQAKTDAQSALDALQVGGRNLVLNSSGLNGSSTLRPALKGATTGSNVTLSYPADGIMITNGATNKTTEWYYQIASSWTPFSNTPLVAGNTYTFSADVMGTVPQAVLRWGFNGGTGGGEYSRNFNINNTSWTRVSITTTPSPSNTGMYWRIQGGINNQYATGWTGGETLKFRSVKIEIGNKATDYTQAPEDIVLDYTTKDNVISQSLTQYQATNDGKVTKAQSDATQALGLVATKVSQTDYNTKTGDLDSKYTAVKQTADQASTDIVAIKSTNTSQDTKINTLTSDVSGTKQSISDIQTEQGKQSTKINTIQTDVSGTKQDISDIKDANGVQDGKIASISTTVDGLSSSFSTYKTTNDGKVAKAQADITANATAISQKVSQTAYDAKTGQLQTDLNTTTTTANQAKTDIVAIKKTDTDQDARMTTIESDANGVKTTVSSLQTTANTQAGSISTLQQRADGIEATVSTLGQINQLFNTEFTPDFAGWYQGISPSSGAYKVGNDLANDAGWVVGSGKHNGSTVLKHIYGNGSNLAFFSDLIPVGEGVDITGSIWAMSTPDFTGSVSVAIYLRYYDANKNYIGVQSVDSGKWTDWTQKYITRITPPGTAYVSFNIQTNGGAGVTYYSQPMLTFSNKVGQYVQGNYNNNVSVAKAQLTADNASLALSNYKTDADGRISKAQADITANASAITQKVAQTVYDAKVGDLTTKVSTAQQTADSVTTSLNSYKSSNDSKVTKAQADIVVNTNAIATKVSQTVYDAKTGQLQADLNTTTATANTSKQDIVAIKSDNTKQDARMTTIESDANGTKTTVSNLQTDLGKANGSITTLQQRADGIEATVSTLGQINQLLNTEFTPDFAGWYLSTNANPTDVVTTQLTPMGTDGFGSNVVSHKGGGNWINSAPIPVTAGMALSFSSRLSVPKTVTSGTPLALYIKAFDANNGQVLSAGYNVPISQLTATPTTFKIENVVMPAGAVKAFAIYGWNVGDEVYISQPMLVFKDKVGAYVQGAYSNSISTAKAQLTADQAITSLNNYKTDADGRISKAQADIIVNANAITQKVSQSDYNAKTGDLTTKVNTAQSTADSATSTIGSYKTSNDARVASAESKITANATAITSKVSQSDYNTKTGQIDGQISTINQTAGKISQTVSDVKAQVDGLSVGGRNLYLNTKALWMGGIGNNGSKVTLTLEAFDSTTNMWHLVAPQQAYNNAGIYLGQGVIQPGDNWALSFDVKGTGNWSSNGARIENSTVTKSVEPLTTSWARVSSTGKKVSAGGAVIFYFDLTNSPLDAYIKLPKLENGTMPTAWSPAPEDVDNKISTVSQTVDGISSIVSDPTTGLTKRVQTAEGTLSQVTGADIPALQKATYWQPYGSLDFNSYTKQGSFFFNTTSAKTNGPTSSTSWTYLMVEQGTADNGRIKQTAWYDGVTGVKITYVRTLNSGTWSPWYANDNDSVATIAQTNGAIKTEISDRQKGDTNTLTQAKDFTTSSISNSESGMRSLITQTSDAIIAKIEATNLVTNSEFDPDNVGWYKLPADGSTIDVSGKVTTPIKSYYADWDAVNGSRGMEFGATTGTWITSEPVRASSTGTYSISVLAGRPIAPATAVTMDFRLGLWDKDKKYITSVGSTNPLNGTTYLPLKYYKSENITVPSNTAFVSFVLGHSGSGTPDAIYHPMINHGATISPYTPTYGTTASSTVLSLLKDNWSIGIADNAGAITNGIVGNSTNMSLISNNVVINAPSTQIKGTAWINSAMIANGAIGKAQIGDASIDTAKIASLDVAKLTGNVSNFIQSNWNGIYSSVAIDGSGMKITTGGTVTTLDQWGTHWSRGNLSSLYGFGYWRDSSGNNTTSTGLYMGVTGSENAFINILGTNGAAAAVLAGSQFDHGANTNIAPGAFNFFTNVNIRTQLAFKGNVYNSPSYIESNEATRTLNFFTGGGSQGGGNYFWFNQNVLSAGTFSSTSRLSQKIVDSPYTEDALGEISKTQLVNFAYKNRPDQNHVSPIIDDVNDTKEYYIPKTILGQDGEYVDMYTMISMAWKALQQVNDRLEKLESR